MPARPRRLWMRTATLAVAVGALCIWYFSEGDYSNIYPGDYVGPETCRECHEDTHDENYEDWRNHAHRVMNQDASDATVLGDFADAEIRYGRGRAVFHRDGPDFLMSIYEGDALLRRHRVTRTVGSLYVQYYIGTQIEGPEPPRHITYRIESKLPFGYSVALARWLPEIYLDSTVAAEREYLAGGSRDDYVYDVAPTHSWNASCLTCHNTYPYVARLWNQSGAFESQVPWRGGYPKPSVEWLGEPNHQGRVKLGSQLRALHGDELVTLGISCESCHFGGREHAENRRKIRFVPTAPELVVRDPRTGGAVASDRKDPFVVNSICSQCHNARLNTYAMGEPAVNSNEATALTGGACRSVIKCTDCHNPHRRGAPSGSPDRGAEIEACLRCHPQFEAPDSRAAHTKHAADVSCLDCHMPRIVAGLDTVIRSHRVSSPSEPRWVESRGPNACNLCHLDRSITWTMRALAGGWDVRAPSNRDLRRWYGEDRSAPLGEVWLRAKSPFVRMAAVEGYARSPRSPDRVSRMLEGLRDGHAYNRTLGLIALERVLGRRLSTEAYDLLADSETRAAQVTRLEESLGATLSAVPPPAQPAALRIQ